MKKVLLSIILLFLPILANAETVEIDGIWYNIISKAKVAEVTRNPNSSDLYSGSIEIPPSVNHNDVDYSVTSIGENAFYQCYGLTSVTIPNSVTSIGNLAFFNCSGLSTINIPNSVTSIGFDAFQECNGLTSVQITDLKAWCEILFDDGSSPLYYAHHLYLNGEEIKDLVIPSSVTSIGSWAFYGCSGLTSVTISNSVTSIGSYAFSWCSGIISVTIGNSVTSIGSYAFFNCSTLTTVTFSSSVTSIGDHAFYQCSALTTITIPNSVTNIGGQAFRECIGLTSITLPNKLTTICDGTFWGCSGLTSVTIGSGVTSIGPQAFANCDDLADVYCLAKKISDDNSWGHEGLYTYPNAFMDSYPQAITLHVPAASIEAYRSMEPWSLFKTIVPLEDSDNPETKKCATPEISYADGKVSLSCETEGVDFISEVTVEDAKNYYDSEFTLSQTYKISVYATKAGYENSDVATREIVIENGQTILFGDLNKDGKVDVADHVKLSDIIMNK